MEETNKLVEEYTICHQKIKLNVIRRDQIWKNIAKGLEKHDIHFTPAQCKSRFANLKRSYRTTKLNNLKPNTNPKKFKYFQQFEDIFGMDDIIAEDPEMNVDDFDWDDKYDDSSSEDFESSQNCIQLPAVKSVPTTTKSTIVHSSNESKNNFKLWTPYETIRLIENFKKFYRDRKSREISKIWSTISSQLMAECIEV